MSPILYIDPDCLYTYYIERDTEIIDDTFCTKLYDKRDSFNFEIVNYPFVLDSNIPEAPAYGVYSSRLIAFARACDSHEDFKLRHDKLCLKLFAQGFKYQKLCKQLRKACDKHNLLFNKYNQEIVVPLPVLAVDRRHVTLRR